MKLTPPAGGVKSGQGKRSAEEMQYEDGLFVCERKAELKELGNFGLFPHCDEAELTEFCKSKVRVASGLAAKCGTKVVSLKRRKDGSAAEVTSELTDIQVTASIFQRLFAELGTESPFGSAIQEIVQILTTAGYEFNRLVHVKRARAILQDDLRFGCSMSTTCRCR